MKLYSTLITAIIMMSLFTQAQIPQGFSYQSVLRDNAGVILADDTVDVRFKVLEGTDSVYVETHNAITNQFGLVTLTVGQGTPVTGDFSTINWTSGSYSLKVEIDFGSGYEFMGTNPMLTVPFAMTAGTAGGTTNGWATSGNDIYNSNSGNVGIGTTTPGYRLHVNGGEVFFSAPLRFNNSGRDDYYSDEVEPAIYSTDEDGNYPFNGVGNLVIQPRTSSSVGGRDIVFATGSGTPQERLIIHNDGHVSVPSGGELFLSVPARFNNSGRNSYFSNATPGAIYSTSENGNYPFNGVGNLVIQPRTSNGVGGDIIFATGAGTPKPRLIINKDGILTFSGEDVARSLTITPASSVDAGAPFIFNTGNAYEFRTDNVPALLINQQGGVEIFKPLEVQDKIWCTEVEVTSVGSFPDYVFKEDYDLMSLNELDQFIQTNGHLPNMPKEADVVENGFGLAEMNVKLVEKVEELTLHLIEKDKELRQVRDDLNEVLELLKVE